MSVEKRVVHHCIPIGIGSTVQQQFNSIVAFTVKRWKKKYQDTQHDTTQSQLLVRAFQLAKQTFHRVHCTGKIKRNQSAKNPQHDNVRNTFHLKCLVKVEFKHCFCSGSNIGHCSSRHCRNQQRKQRSHSQVYHQYFQCEYQSCNRRLEDTSNSTGSTTAY